MASQRFNCDLFIIVDFKPHFLFYFWLESNIVALSIFELGQESCEGIIDIFEQEIANVITAYQPCSIHEKLHSKLFTELPNENELWIYLVG